MTDVTLHLKEEGIQTFDIRDPGVPAWFIERCAFMSMLQVQMPHLKIVDVDRENKITQIELLSSLPDLRVETVFDTTTLEQESRLWWLAVAWELAHHPAASLSALLHIARILPFRVLDNPYWQMILPFERVVDAYDASIGVTKLALAEAVRASDTHRWSAEWYHLQTVHYHKLEHVDSCYHLPDWPHDPEGLPLYDPDAIQRVVTWSHLNQLHIVLGNLSDTLGDHPYFAITSASCTPRSKDKWLYFLKNPHITFR